MTVDSRHPAPIVELEVDGRPLPREYVPLLRRVQVEQDFDGADQLTLEMSAWDEFDADYRVIGETVLAPGAKVVVWAGYGGSRHAVGRYTVVEHQPDISPSVASVTIVAFDDFARLMDNTAPGDYGHQESYDQVAQIVARRYGWGFVGDAGRPVPHRRRRAKKDSKRRTKSAQDLTTSVIKPGGDTDARMLKLMAGWSGFLQPKVRYIPKGDPRIRALEQAHGITESLGGTDVLHFVKGRLSAQRAGRGYYRFDAQPDGVYPATLESFRPTWSTAGIPQAVRVTGVSADGTELVIAEAEMRDRASILAGRTDRVQVTRIETRRLTKQDRKRFRDPSQVVIEVQGQRKPVEQYSATQRHKVQVLGREVLAQVLTYTRAEDVEAVARGWLLARVQLMITAESTASNMTGLETLYPGQAHEFLGLPAEYDGFYLIRGCSHVWDESGHTVSMKKQKLYEAPTSLNGLGRRVA